MKDIEVLHEVRADVKTILASMPVLALKVKRLEAIVYSTLGATGLGFLAWLGSLIVRADQQLKGP